jgi:uncharacterized protein YcgI (DUF1989 family)
MTITEVPDFTGRPPRAYLTIHPGEGDTTEVNAGQYIEITDSLGGQTAAFCAFRQGYMDEYLSTKQTIVQSGTIMLQQGQTLFSNFGNPMLVLVKDDVGRHDLLLPVDDGPFYRSRFVSASHQTTRDALAIALQRYELGYHQVPDPVNVFQHVGFRERGTWELRAPLSQANDSVVFRAEMDIVICVAGSADDITDRNNHNLTDIIVRVYLP